MAVASESFIRPMLANPLPVGTSVKDYADGNWVAEEKFDGHRICALVADGKVYAWSRYGKRRSLPTHISNDIVLMPEGYYDGELVGPGGRSWNISAGSNTGNEEFVIFDLLHVAGGSLLEEPYAIRRQYLETVASALPEASKVRITKQLAVSQKIVKAIWKAGGEGVILKELTHLYRPGNRSDHWLKVKSRIDVTMTIVDFIKGENGPQSVAKVVDAKGVTTQVKIPTNELLAQIAENAAAWIGRKIEVSAQEATADSYRHPRWHHAVGSDT